MTDAARPVVAVIGGGIAGLVAARALSRSVQVIVLDAAPRLGGKVAGGECAGVSVELGPDQFLRRDPILEQLCEELGLGDDLVAPTGGGAGVFSYGRLRPLPGGLVLGVPTDLDAVAASGIVSAHGIELARQAAAGGRELTEEDLGIVPSDGELSAGEILRSSLGDEVVDRLVDPLLGGINGGGVDSLSLGITAPQIARAILGHRDVVEALATSATGDRSQSGGRAVAGHRGSAVEPGGRREPGGAALPGRPPSPFFGLRGGLVRLVDALVAELSRAGVAIRTATTVNGVSSQDDAARSISLACSDGSSLEVDGLVLALPGHGLGALLDEVSHTSAAAAREIEHSTVVVCTFAFEASGLPDPTGWTGFLVPRVEGRLMTAVTYLSDKWPWMSSDSIRLVRVSTGRFGDERAMQLGDDELLRHIRDELAEIAGISGEPVEQSVTRWPNGFPQYRPGHRALVARLEQGLAGTPAIRLAGAALGGIGLPACASSGERAAGQVLEALGR